LCQKVETHQHELVSPILAKTTKKKEKKKKEKKRKIISERRKEKKGINKLIDSGTESRTSLRCCLSFSFSAIFELCGSCCMNQSGCLFLFGKSFCAQQQHTTPRSEDLQE
jgi:hypothetical protein